MESQNIPCPFLPSAAGAMTHSCLTAFGENRDGQFYITALRYSQYLWLRKLPARSILSLCRGLYSPISADEPALMDYPLPYQAYRWLIEHAYNVGFLGNPRISFQHQAVRIRGKDSARVRARAHALWWLTCKSRPEMHGDPDCSEPIGSLHAVLDRLSCQGLEGEVDWFLAAADYSDDSGDSSSGICGGSTGRRSGLSE